MDQSTFQYAAPAKGMNYFPKEPHSSNILRTFKIENFQFVIDID